MAFTSPLLSLPLEVRTLIYNYIFQSPTSHITLEQFRSRSHFRIICPAQPDWCLSLALLQTCRQLYFETRHLSYVLNSIDLQLWHAREVYGKKYDPTQLSQRLYLFHAHFPKAEAGGDLRIVDVKRTLETAIIWGQTNLPHDRLDDWNGRRETVLPTGVRVVYHDPGSPPVFSPIRRKRPGKMEAWRRFRWNFREGWWSFFG